MLRTINILFLKDNNPLKISGLNHRCLQKITMSAPPPWIYGVETLHFEQLCHAMQMS
jgi:hypothetical protein